MKRAISLIIIYPLLLPFLVYSQEPVLHELEMEDGIKLLTDIYFPTDGNGPWPVVMGRTPYGRDTDSGSIMLPPDARENMASSGIVVVIQDVRGRNGSEGEQIPFAADGWGELKDGLTTLNWIRGQEWCNGKIATIGASAGGVTQIQLAGTGPEGIVGQIIDLAPMSNYHSFAFNGGVFRREIVEGWLMTSQWPVEENLALIREHPFYDDYWRLLNLKEQIGKVNWPVMIGACWYDLFVDSSIDLYEEIRAHAQPAARDNVVLLIGPYTHTTFNETEHGELRFPNNAVIPYDSLWPKEVTFIEHWLLGKSLQPTPPRVLYYVMGEITNLPNVRQSPGNEWRIAEDWPPPAQKTKWYLTNQNTLQTALPQQEGTYQYSYDPNDPVPTRGGQNFMVTPGPYDQRLIEHRNDVILFTTDSLSEPLEVTGKVTAILYVSTSAKDTDFTAKLTDVYPDGKSILIADNIRKLSMRGEFTYPQEVVPNQIYRLEIEIGNTSIIFNTGHRMRLAISSSNNPRFEPNPNTGNPDWTSDEKVVAQQTVFVGGNQASHLLLPIPFSESAVSEWGELK
ncbi:MAG: CocE/NonD family hydrolase [Candidatus Omnitrophota bacterium]|jgi:predicted acyl esterase|nr:MAG: CocE/NonD family hydrolase [Candidatus Omnitrophota bacterium]